MIPSMSSQKRIYWYAVPFCQVPCSAGRRVIVSVHCNIRARLYSRVCTPSPGLVPVLVPGKQSMPRDNKLARRMSIVQPHFYLGSKRSNYWRTWHFHSADHVPRDAAVMQLPSRCQITSHTSQDVGTRAPLWEGGIAPLKRRYGVHVHT